MKKLTLLALAAIVVPACGGGGSGVGGGGAPAGPIVLLSDDWSSGPSHNWGGMYPVVAVDYGVGYQAPSMYVNANGASTAAEVRTAATFNTTNGLTIAMDVLLNSGTVAQINIFSSSSALTSATITTTNTTFYIEGQSLTLNYTADSSWHRYSFFTNAGHAVWLRDGTIYFSAAYSPTTVFVDLRDYTNGTHFDNALITSP